MSKPTGVVVLAAALLAGAAACPRGSEPSRNPGPAPSLPPSAQAAAGKPAAPPPARAPAAATTPSPEQLSFGAGRRLRPRDPHNLCEVADANIDRAAKEILADLGDEPPSPPERWSRAQKPRYWDRMVERFTLESRDWELLGRNGFVVPARLEAESYTRALHEIYQSQLPLYLSVDAVLHAVFKAHEQLLVTVELDLAQQLAALLAGLRLELPRAAGEYPAQVAGDLDLYLAVAHGLATGEAGPHPQHGRDPEAATLIRHAVAADAMVVLELFGRRRVIDFSQYRPRGHYARHPELQPYFRAAMWLSRLELNLVSRSSRSSAPGLSPDPRPTPREVLIALGLADLAERAGVLEAVARLDLVWTAFGGRREDVSLPDLRRLRQKARIGSLREAGAADRLVAAIGNDFQRTTRIHYMPQGSDSLPAIATVLGPRISPDTTALTQLVHSAVPDRYMLSAADVGFVLGHDRAKPYLASELARYPALGAQLAKARAQLARPPNGSLYEAWLEAIRALGENPGAPGAVLPSFMRTEAFADLRLGSALAAYGQLRHNHVLIAGQAYEEGGCEVPDGWVEPAPAVYRALMAYAATGERLMRALSRPAEQQHFARLGYLLEVLHAIATDELAGRPLSAAERRFLSMVVEIRPAVTDFPGSYDGWYFSLYRSLEEAFEEPAFIADYYTSSNRHEVAYLGAERPRYGFFVVDVGGPPRVMVGPVASAFELRGPLAERLTDRAAEEGEAVALPQRRQAPWTRSYTTPAAPEPRLLVQGLGPAEEQPPGRLVHKFAVRSPEPLWVTIDLLDHHRHVMGTGRGRAGGSASVIRVPIGVAAERAGGPEMLRVRAGGYVAFVPSIDSFGDTLNLGGVPFLSAEEWDRLSPF